MLETLTLSFFPACLPRRRVECGRFNPRDLLLTGCGIGPLHDELALLSVVTEDFVNLVFLAFRLSVGFFPTVRIRVFA